MLFLPFPAAEQDIQGRIEQEQGKGKEEQADAQGQPGHLPNPQGFSGMRAEKGLDLISSVAGKKAAGFIKTVQAPLPSRFGARPCLRAAFPFCRTGAPR